MPTLTKMPGRILDVVARRLDEPRRLAQLREHAARALGAGAWAKSAWPARLDAEHVGVELRVALPGADVFELEHPRLDVRGEHRMLEPLDRR